MRSDFVPFRGYDRWYERNIRALREPAERDFDDIELAALFVIYHSLTSCGYNLIKLYRGMTISRPPP